MDQPAAQPAELPGATTVAADNPTASHPSYAEMITAAIVAESLQGKEGGSSKRAIAKYIDRVYPNLPPSHSSLLTHHLKRLKDSGHLIMVKNSYQLPSHPRSAVPVAPSPAGDSAVSPPSPKRRPGRPSKPKSGLPVAENGSGSSKRARGRPSKQPQQLISEVQPVTVNGQVGQKRRPGRPAKQPPVVPFVEPVSETQQTNSGLVGVPVEGLPKRRPGRPPKGNVSGPSGPSVSRGGRPRGRPKKYDLGPVSSAVGKRPRGRPLTQGGAAIGGGVVRKGRGRPPKSGGVGSVKVKPRRRTGTGRSVGRPKKNAEQGQGTGSEELIRTLEHMQSKIRDAVDVIKPHVANENASDAMTALQQLEELATMNVTAPTLTAPPPTTEPMGLTAPPNTSVPAPPSLNEPPPEATVTAPTVSLPGPFSVTAPTMTMMAPFHAPSSIESQPPLSWFSSNEAQS